MWFDDEIDKRLFAVIEKSVPNPDASTDEILRTVTEFNEKIEGWLQVVLSTVTNDLTEIDWLLNIRTLG